MKIKYWLCFFISFSSFSQTILKGIVKDKQGTTIFGANVYVKSAPEKGTISDFDGKFSLAIHKKKMCYSLLI